ncbi:MAG: hypothetical protein ACTIJA_07545 [Bavariicoccus seileri]|uniref:hypothetical protein n=1 Tax=Bavariicoccus seileri TaxID=549685 RepID=UPI003F97E7A1
MLVLLVTSELLAFLVTIVLFLIDRRQMSVGVFGLLTLLLVYWHTMLLLGKPIDQIITIALTVATGLILLFSAYIVAYYGLRDGRQIKQFVTTNVLFKQFSWQQLKVLIRFLLAIISFIVVFSFTIISINRGEGEPVTLFMAIMIAMIAYSSFMLLSWGLSYLAIRSLPAKKVPAYLATDLGSLYPKERQSDHYQLVEEKLNLLLDFYATDEIDEDEIGVDEGKPDIFILGSVDVLSDAMTFLKSEGVSESLIHVVATLTGKSDEMSILKQKTLDEHLFDTQGLWVTTPTKLLVEAMTSCHRNLTLEFSLAVLPHVKWHKRLFYWAEAVSSLIYHFRYYHLAVFAVIIVIINLLF